MKPCLLLLDCCPARGQFWRAGPLPTVHPIVHLLQLYKSVIEALLCDDAIDLMLLFPGGSARNRLREMLGESALSNCVEGPLSLEHLFSRLLLFNDSLLSFELLVLAVELLRGPDETWLGGDVIRIDDVLTAVGGLLSLQVA